MEQEKPKIEFPCPDYIIKVMGEASGQFQDRVENIIIEFAPSLDRSRTESRMSAKGNYMSVSVWITATGIEQLTLIHQALVADSSVKMVL